MSYATPSSSSIMQNIALPHHWRRQRLKYAVSINPETLSEKTAPDTPLTYIEIGDIGTSGHIRNSTKTLFGTAPNRARRKVATGDTILSTVRTYLRAIAYIDTTQENLVASTGFAVLRPHTILHPRFLYWLVQSTPYIEQIVSSTEGMGYPSITSAQLGTSIIWIPPLNEQITIASKLDEQTNRIDKLIAKQQQLIALLQEKRATLIWRAVGGQLHQAEADIHMPQQTTPPAQRTIPWLPTLPSHWDTRPVWTLFRIGRGRIISQHDIANNPGPYPVYSSQTENDGVFGSINTYDFSGDSLTWTTDGEHAGTLFLRQGNYNCTNVCGILQPYAQNIYLPFFTYALNILTPYYVRRDINPKLTSDMMAHIHVPLPSYKEQQAIVHFIQTKTKPIETLIAKLRQGIPLMYTYMHSLITSRVCGV